MTYKVKLVSGEFGIEEFEYDTEAEQLAGVARLVTAARIEYAKDGIYREVLISIGDEPEYPGRDDDPATDALLNHEVAESRPSSATHSAPNGASFVSAISAAPFLTRGRG